MNQRHFIPDRCDFDLLSPNVVCDQFDQKTPSYNAQQPTLVHSVNIHLCKNSTAVSTSNEKCKMVNYHKNDETERRVLPTNDWSSKSPQTKNRSCHFGEPQDIFFQPVLKSIFLLAYSEVLVGFNFRKFASQLGETGSRGYKEPKKCRQTDGEKSHHVIFTIQVILAFWNGCRVEKTYFKAWWWTFQAHFIWYGNYEQGGIS